MRSCYSVNWIFNGFNKLWAEFSLNASVTAKSAVPFFSFPLFHAFPQAPLRSFAPVFSRSAISRNLSTIQKGTACSLNFRVKTLHPRALISEISIFCLHFACRKFLTSNFIFFALSTWKSHQKTKRACG